MSVSGGSLAEWFKRFSPPPYSWLGAGTDGDVWIWFDGTNGRSNWLYCDNSADNFENGQTDYFYFNLPDLGYLQAAWVYFRPLGAGSAWFFVNCNLELTGGCSLF